MAHLDFGDYIGPAPMVSPERRRQRTLQMLAAMCCASFTIVGAAALFLAATY